MKSFDEVVNEKESLKNKWIETPDYTVRRMLNDYRYKFYEKDKEITNEILYMMLMDVMDKLDEIESHILNKEEDILANQEDLEEDLIEEQ